MTARLVATAALSPGPDSAWATTLRACGAYEAFLRTYRGLETDREAAEFLLLDRLFPRSVVLRADPGRAVPGQPRGERPAGRVPGRGAAAARPGPRRARVPLASSDIVTDLPGEMERLQRTCAAASDAVTRRYFAGAEAIELAGRGSPMTHAVRASCTPPASRTTAGSRVVQRGPDDAADHAPSQIVVHSRLEVAPTPWAYTYRDYWGTAGHRLRGARPAQRADRHRHLDGAGQPARTAAGPALSWDDAARAEVQRPLLRVRSSSPTGCAPTEDLAALADEIAARARTARARPRARSARWSTDEVKYVSGSTTVDGHAPTPGRRGPASARTWRTSPSGRCASLGIPARYVSGYLHPQARAGGRRHRRAASRTPGSSGGTAAGVGFDPTNDLEPATGTSSSPRGRDYTDVTPLSGIFSGGTTSSMAVDVQVTRLS